MGSLPETERLTDILLVPGGNARHKVRHLRPSGIREVREFVRLGGSYIGICGGAGLALTADRSDAGLGLCPWTRKPYLDRFQHLASGHVRARLRDHPLVPETISTGPVSLPIWWPGRFSPSSEDTVEILASAEGADEDFWLGDLPVRTIPRDFFSLCLEEYGVNLSSDFLHDIPLVVTGTSGRGRYLLSYSHLETPESPSANLWLTHVLSRLGTEVSATTPVPDWDLDTVPDAWRAEPAWEPLHEAYRKTRALLDLGTLHHLFFRRTPWLWGWRHGLAGAALNSLHTTLHELLGRQPTDAACRYWREKRAAFLQIAGIFFRSAEECLLTIRVADALESALLTGINETARMERTRAIFGSPPNGGGLIGTLTDIVEEMIYQTDQ